jgi:hypothetical protein
MSMKCFILTFSLTLSQVEFCFVYDINLFNLIFVNMDYLISMSLHSNNKIKIGSEEF